MGSLSSESEVAILGAGTMGIGVAQVAATYGHTVKVWDKYEQALGAAQQKLSRILDRLVEKAKISQSEADQISERVEFTTTLSSLANSNLFIEAVVEDLGIKQELFGEIEAICSNDAILATNTSSLSVAAISSKCEVPERLLGIHFFNPAPLMPLVEIVPSIKTAASSMSQARSLIDSWQKTTVLAKDTPGFIVNRVARPFYGEALRILEEDMANVATIDWAMKTIGGFRMGPFELMDFIGNDINYTVTETVFEAFFYDPRYKPSFTQKRMVEANLLGRKTECGFYDYKKGTLNPDAVKSEKLGQQIFDRIICMLINEAIDAVFLKIASIEDIDLAMTKGVNYPKGLLTWADQIGLEKVLAQLNELHAEYGEDRYRASPLLKRMVREGQTFYT